MSNEAVRIKKRNDIASRISTYLVLALVAILCAGPFYLAGVIIFEDWRKYL